MTLLLTLLALALAALSAALAAANLALFRSVRRGAIPSPLAAEVSAKPTEGGGAEGTAGASSGTTPIPSPSPQGGRERGGSESLISILIPARNEEQQIEASVRAALASRGMPVEVVVMDDGSTDRTAEIVRRIAAEDPRLRLAEAPPLPAGWTGKVHACQRLAEAARGTHLLFVDADVRVLPDAAAALASYAERRGVGLVSAVPRQVIGSLGEGLTVPMINFLMLGYLPMALMRRWPHPGLGAACGQLLMVEREAYFAAGGHAAIKHLLHDGIQLARRFRLSGSMTDVVPGADLAQCRMYRRFGEAWAGFSKNAHEGMATPGALPVWTVLLGGGHVLPFVLALGALAGSAPTLAFVAAGLSLGTRAAITVAAREPWWTVALHPFAVLTCLAIQWSALLRVSRRGAAGWKGRLYPAE